MKRICPNCLAEIQEDATGICPQCNHTLPPLPELIGEIPPAPGIPVPLTKYIWLDKTLGVTTVLVSLLFLGFGLTSADFLSYLLAFGVSLIVIIGVRLTCGRRYTIYRYGMDFGFSLLGLIILTIILSFGAMCQWS